MPPHLPRRQLVRYVAVALVPVALSLAAISSFFYPISDPSELGWWATPPGEAASLIAAVIALPAIPVVMTVGGLLTVLGIPEGWSFFVGAVIGGAVAALVWGWLAVTS